MTVCYYHVKYAFQSESTLYSCLNVRELLAWSRGKICSLSECNWTRTHNQLFHKRTLNYLAKWLSVRFWTKWFWIRVQLQRIEVPKKGEIYVKFKNYDRKIKWPFIIYGDFESILVPKNNGKSHINKYQKYTSCCYGYKLTCND